MTKTWVKARCVYVYDNVKACEGKLQYTISIGKKSRGSNVGIPFLPHRHYHHHHHHHHHHHVPTPATHPHRHTLTSLCQGAQMAMRGLGTSAKITTKITAPQMAKFLRDRGGL